MLQFLALAFALVQPPAHTVPSQRVEQPAPVGPSLTVPPEVKGKPGSFIDIVATTDCDDVRFVIITPGIELRQSGTAAIVVSPTGGSYRVLVYGAKGGKASEPAFTNIKIEGEKPPEPPPAPTFQSKLQEAFADETDPEKATQAAKLASVYRSGQKHASEATVKTWGDLFADMAATAKALELVGKLPLMQKVIGAELNSSLPSIGGTAKPIDDAGRKLAAATFARIAESLGAVK